MSRSSSASAPSASAALERRRTWRRAAARPKVELHRAAERRPELERRAQRRSADPGQAHPAVRRRTGAELGGAGTGVAGGEDSRLRARVVVAERVAEGRNIDPQPVLELATRPR